MIDAAIDLSPLRRGGFEARPPLRRRIATPDTLKDQR